MRSFLVFIVGIACIFSPALTVRAQTATPVVNIFFEAETLTPAFYQGRPEPSVGSTVRAVAILSGVQNADQYQYVWTVNQQTVSGGGALGRTTIAIPVNYSNEPIVSVSIYDQNGDLVAKNSELLELSEPFIAFYEDNPLRGYSRLLSNNGFIMSADEATFRAEPYFMSTDIFARTPKLEWDIDGQSVTPNKADPQTITLLRTDASSGSSVVGFYLHNTVNLLQSGQGNFTVDF